ncbi:MAG: EamA family transporter [Anaerolineae bacterium]|jgi:drug/metabolite transporter (DMT)-like permease|nr:EamA family transporter [Anaerolineae bacterium]
MSRTSPRTMTSKEWLMMFGLSLLWGSSFLLIKYALKGFQPFSIVLVRVVVASVVLWSILRWQGKKLPHDKKIWRDFFVISLINNVIPFSIIMWSETQISSGLTSVLNASAPLWTVILALALRAEQVTWNRIIGVIFGFTGVIVMIGFSSLEGFGLHILAQVGMLLATLCYALAGQYTQRLKALEPNTIATGQVLCSSIIMLPVVALADKPWLQPMPSASSWAAVIALGVLGTAVAYLLYFRILLSAGPGNALLVTFIIPVNAVLLGIIVLGETFAPYQFGGMFLILLGLLAVDGRVFRFRKTQPSA